MAHDDKQNAFAPFVALMNNSEYTMEDLSRSQHLELPAITSQDMSGKVVVVTGANAGIGFETSKSIASMKPKKLIMACRNVEKAEAAKKSVESSSNFHDVEIWQLDLASVASTLAFAKKYNESGLPLDLLVSNAGLGMGPWVETEDGYEITTQVNHICNALLVSQLYPAMKKAAQAQKSHDDKFPRINLVASDTHFWAPFPLPEDPHPVKTLLTTKNGSIMGVYPSTKLMNILFAKGFAARCPDAIYICSSNPGYTESELGQKDPSTGAAKDSHKPFMKQRTTYEGAKTIIDASINPKMGENGGYYSDMKESQPRSSVRGETGKKFADNVWHDTVEILKKHEPNLVIASWKSK